MKPSRRKPKKMSIRQDRHIRCPAHLKWIRGCACSITMRHICTGRMEAAHVRRGTDGSAGRKPSDIWVIPLCAGAHAEQHSIGEQAFEKRYSIIMKNLSEDYAMVSPHRAKWMRND